MANAFTYQVLRDTTTDAVIKLTGRFDGASGSEANTARIQVANLANALATNGYPRANAQGGAANTALSYYDVQVTGIKYNVNMGAGAVELFWNGGTPSTIALLNGVGTYGAETQDPAIPNNAGTPNGNIGVNTYGVVANTSYTVVLTLRKNNAHFQRGQFNDPSAFNFGEYALKP